MLTPLPGSLWAYEQPPIYFQFVLCCGLRSEVVQYGFSSAWLHHFMIYNEPGDKINYEGWWKEIGG